MSIWTLANIGYYLIFPVFGISTSYNSAPIIIAAYFGVWSILSMYNFFGTYRGWIASHSTLVRYGLLSLGSAGVLLGSVYLFSLLPLTHATIPQTDVDILFATPWYFLPKAFEILLQQLLITVLILELSYTFQTFKNVVIGYALCFGGAHVLLFVLDQAPAPYAILITVSAVLTSFVFPYLILKFREGFVYAYMVHFIFYIVLATFLHILPPFAYLV